RSYCAIRRREAGQARNEGFAKYPWTPVQVDPTHPRAPDAGPGGRPPSSHASRPSRPTTTHARATDIANRGGRSMLFLSQAIGKPVLDRHGEAFGKVRDLIVALGEQYPPITGLVIRVAGGRDIFLPWSDVEEFDSSRARLHTSSIDITNFRQRPNEIRLYMDLLDKQIVDVEGRKIVRVNDIQVAPVRGRLRLIAVDVGLAGILRRLSLSGPGERLARALHMPIEDYIEWEEVDPVESS